MKYFDSKHVVYYTDCNKLHFNQSSQGLGVYVAPIPIPTGSSQGYYTFTSSELGTFVAVHVSSALRFAIVNLRIVAKLGIQISSR